MPSAIAMSTTHSSATRHAGFFGFGGLTLRPSVAGASAGDTATGTRTAPGERVAVVSALLAATGSPSSGPVPVTRRAPRPFILSCRRDGARVALRRSAPGALVPGQDATGCARG